MRKGDTRGTSRQEEEWFEGELRNGGTLPLVFLLYFLTGWQHVCLERGYFPMNYVQVCLNVSVLLAFLSHRKSKRFLRESVCLLYERSWLE